MFQPETLNALLESDYKAARTETGPLQSYFRHLEERYGDLQKSESSRGWEERLNSIFTLKLKLTGLDIV